MSQDLPSIKEILDTYIKDIGLIWTDETSLSNQADVDHDGTGDIKIISGLDVIKNDIYARLLTARKTILEGKTYPAETTEDDFGSSLPYIIGRKRTPNNIRLAMLYIAEALIDYPYLEITTIDAEVYTPSSSKHLNRETVKITIRGRIVLPAEGIVTSGSPEEIQVSVTY